MRFYGLLCQGTQALCTSRTSSVAAPWQRPAENSPVLWCVRWDPQTCRGGGLRAQQDQKGPRREQQPPAGVRRLPPRDASLPPGIKWGAPVAVLVAGSSELAVPLP